MYAAGGDQRRGEINNEPNAADRVHHNIREQADRGEDVPDQDDETDQEENVEDDQDEAIDLDLEGDDVDD